MRVRRSVRVHDSPNKRPPIIDDSDVDMDDPETSGTSLAAGKARGRAPPSAPSTGRKVKPGPRGRKIIIDDEDEDEDQDGLEGELDVGGDRDQDDEEVEGEEDDVDVDGDGEAEDDDEEGEADDDEGEDEDDGGEDSDDRDRTTIRGGRSSPAKSPVTTASSSPAKSVSSLVKARGRNAGTASSAGKVQTKASPCRPQVTQSSSKLKIKLKIYGAANTPNATAPPTTTTNTSVANSTVNSDVDADGDGVESADEEGGGEADGEGEEVDVEEEEEEEEDEDDAESEDEEEDEDDDDFQVVKRKAKVAAHPMTASTSASTATTTTTVISVPGGKSVGPSRKQARPMTTRQAVLASVLDPSHVALDIDGSGGGISVGGSKQKKILNEDELRLRREETARKRKNLSERRLEDEKAETINRLLKKQSKPRNKRNTALNEERDSTLPNSTSGTRSSSVARGRGRPKAGTSTPTTAAPKKSSKLKPEQGKEGKEGEDGEEGEEEMDVDEEDGEGEEEREEERAVKVPTMYRWISTTRSLVTPAVSVVNDGGEGEKEKERGNVDGDVDMAPPPEEKNEEKRMRVTFSIPICALPTPPSSPTPVQTTIAGNVSGAATLAKEPPKPLAPLTGVCAKEGCENKAKYRLVKDWEKGVCGATCWKLVGGR